MNQNIKEQNGTNLGMIKFLIFIDLTYKSQKSFLIKHIECILNTRGISGSKHITAIFSIL